MVSKKLKVVCSVKLSRLEFVPLPIADQLWPNFYKLLCVCGTEVYNTRLKKYHVQCC